MTAGQRSKPHELQYSRADTFHACLLQMPDGQPVAIKLYIGLIRAALSHSEGNNTVFGSRRFKRWENDDEALDKFMMVHETIIDWLNQVQCLSKFHMQHCSNNVLANTGRCCMCLSSGWAASNCGAYCRAWAAVWPQERYVTSSQCVQ